MFDWNSCSNDDPSPQTIIEEEQRRYSHLTDLSGAPMSSSEQQSGSANGLRERQQQQSTCNNRLSNSELCNEEQNFNYQMRCVDNRSQNTAITDHYPFARSYSEPERAQTNDSSASDNLMDLAGARSLELTQRIATTRANKQRDNTQQTNPSDPMNVKNIPSNSDRAIESNANSTIRSGRCDAKPTKSLFYDGNQVLSSSPIVECIMDLGVTTRHKLAYYSEQILSEVEAIMMFDVSDSGLQISSGLRLIRPALRFCFFALIVKLFLFATDTVSNTLIEFLNFDQRV